MGQDMTFEYAGTRVAVNVADHDALSAAVRGRLSQGRGFAVATLNLDHMVKLRSDPEFRAAYARHDFVTADGNPVVWLSRLASRPVDLVPGSDAILPLCRVAAELGAAIGLYGSTEETLGRAKTYLEAEVPGLRVAFAEAPPMGFDPDGDAARDALGRMQAEGARLVFLALGAPRQECLAARGREIAPDIGFVSIGAGLDFFAGHQRRAPRLVRKLALEWLWRMLSDPRRLAPRYAKCGAILPLEVIRALRQRHSP
ncbi:polymer biosynthesis protein, WecB/TagA/CpsF family [Roseivivax halotolerans]|uniref:Polymer biosynthesis protein, WecB/TagA/CpsF family n=2 Tax=Roseivivax halotolerans TaxID=93684 RepID=A0A1I5YXS0_9RHOB|nr:polymer biosynthesis protein, WecB/TagA/CpsF family [Roseivivax halotolerans]